MMLYLPLDWNNTVGDPGVLSISHIVSAVKSLHAKVRYADSFDVEAHHPSMIDAASGSEEAMSSERLTRLSGSAP